MAGWHLNVSDNVLTNSKSTWAVFVRKSLYRKRRRTIYMHILFGMAPSTHLQQWFEVANTRIKERVTWSSLDLSDTSAECCVDRSDWRCGRTLPQSCGYGLTEKTAITKTGSLTTDYRIPPSLISCPTPMLRCPLKATKGKIWFDLFVVC